MDLPKEGEEDSMFSNFSQQPTVAATEVQERLTLEESWPMLAILGIGLLIASRKGEEPKLSKQRQKRRRR